MENPLLVLLSSSFSSSSTGEHDDVQLSAKNEPKALVAKEMRLAREAALKVINNNSEKEALKIFLQPVKSTSVKPTWDGLSSPSEQSDEDEDEDCY